MSLNESSSGGTSSTSKLLVTAVTHFEDGVTLLIRLNTHHLAPWPAMARSWGRIQELQKLSGSSRIFAPWKMSTSICIIVYIYIYIVGVGDYYVYNSQSSVIPIARHVRPALRINTFDRSFDK